MLLYVKNFKFFTFAHLVAREIALSSRAIIAGEMKTFFGTNHEKSSGAGQKVYIVYLTTQDHLENKKEYHILSSTRR